MRGLEKCGVWVSFSGPGPRCNSVVPSAGRAQTMSRKAVTLDGVVSLYQCDRITRRKGSILIYGYCGSVFLSLRISTFVGRVASSHLYLNQGQLLVRLAHPTVNAKFVQCVPTVSLNLGRLASTAYHASDLWVFLPWRSLVEASQKLCRRLLEALRTPEVASPGA